jgi:large subunit ribosomal protein L5
MNTKKLYQDILPTLQHQLVLKNILSVPKITKIVVNMGVGQAALNKGVLLNAQKCLDAAVGYRSVQTCARRSVASFKIREGWPIGCMVTLRRRRIYDFLDKLLFVALPRIRDFRGLSKKAFDGHGNYHLGLLDMSIFPEVEHLNLDATFGAQLSLVTTAPSDAVALMLLKNLNFPFKD